MRYLRRLLLLLVVASLQLGAAFPAQGAGGDRVRGRTVDAPLRGGTSRHALPALSWAPRDGLTRALEAGRVSEAEYALFRVESLFRPGRLRARFGSIAPASQLSATMVGRDLALRLRFLRGSLRTRAIRASPSDRRPGRPVRRRVHGA